MQGERDEPRAVWWRVPLADSRSDSHSLRSRNHTFDRRIFFPPSLGACSQAIRYCTSIGFVFYSNFQDFIVGFEFQTWRAQVWTSDWIQQAGGKSRLFQLQVSWIYSYMPCWKGSFGTYLCAVPLLLDKGLILTTWQLSDLFWPLPDGLHLIIFKRKQLSESCNYYMLKRCQKINYKRCSAAL